MGGPLSRCLSDLVIENKIDKPIAEHSIWGSIWDWVRLIDDTLSVWDSKDIFLDFFVFLNTLHPGIKWTYEMEEEGKKSASDRYIHYTSTQVWKEKACAIRTLKRTAKDYCSNEAL